eukprot:TRINITY_DN1647_c0_g1_i1.p3 TRINITY_DN1647_c0_g1~~TRINITY_DN1647_c0_g1_i1.p3  ORF type:complete len:113 (+),score=32.79 TRINITY_DN1647_c0_g1_i1:160-498(+)
MAECLEQYNDAGVPEEHMKYSQLQMESVTRLPDFMSGPLSRNLDVVPGIGAATITKLNDAEIFTLDQLMGKFMSFDRDCSLMLGWLEENKLCGRYAETCVHALAMKLHSLLD